MANTKPLTREERKAKKREQRRATKLLFARLSPADKKKFRKSEHKSVKAFVAEQQAAAAE